MSGCGARVISREADAIFVWTARREEDILNIACNPIVTPLRLPFRDSCLCLPPKSAPSLDQGADGRSMSPPGLS